jgi:cancer susceptibility candidate protein 1
VTRQHFLLSWLCKVFHAALTVHVVHVQCADEHADKGDVLLTAQQGPLQWGLWVNTHKNPRFKLIDFGGLGMTVEIPKQLALASIALRVQVGMPLACTA